ncbi:MAG: choice-of-anchor I family protein, partial [Cyanobacteria bacterium P01_H01_bin.130]
DLSNGLENATVATADFTAFNDQADALRASGVRIFGPNATVAQDLEPEFVTITPDSSTAVVTLQENNAIAIVDLETATVSSVLPLGGRDATLPGNGFDASDEDGVVDIRNHPVFSFYQPDTIDTFTVGGNTYFITANEGDARDYDGFSEESRVEDLTLDPTVFPNASDLQAESNLGRLIATNVQGDTDGDGDIDQIFSFGGRSFSVWNSDGSLLFDSGEQLERITLAANAEFFNSTNDENSFDSRSDDKGPEPEAVTVGQFNGAPHAFIGLERVGGVAVYDLSNPAAPEFVTYVNNRDFSGDPEAGTAGDLGPEGLAFIDAVDSPTSRSLLAVSNEVSGTTTLHNVGSGITSLQILATSDLEGGVDAISSAPNFAAVVEGLETDAANNNIPSILLSAGDNYLPGPFFSAAGDRGLRDTFQSFYSDEFGVTLDNVREGVGRLDISIMNALGFDASAVGNHEFDAGTTTFGDIIGPDIRGDELGDVRWPGAQFPYLSANLDFSEDGALGDLFTSEIRDSTDFRTDLTNLSGAADGPKLAPATVIERNGELIGVVGATTPGVSSISSTGEVQVLGTTENDIAILASTLQPTIDQLRGRGINKIITLTHLQQFQLEQQLVPLLGGVDVAIAGGSDTLLADETDRLRAGDVAAETFPVITTNADGDPVALISTDGQYSYVGRLVVDFDENGVLIPSSIDAAQSGAFATDAQGVTDVWSSVAPGQDPFGAGTDGATVQGLVGEVQGIVTERDGQIFGSSTVYLEGRRSAVRTEETNLGNLTADANLAAAQAVDPTVQVSIKNGGGIRDSIGVIDGLTGELEPTEANPLAGKEAGQVSQLDIEGTLRFNNGLTTLTLTAAQLQQVIEHGVGQSGDGATPGRFPQVGGLSFSFDASLPENQRVRSLAITDSSGASVDTVVQDGALVGDPSRQIRIVTLD